MCVNFRSASSADIQAVISEDVQPDLLSESAEIWPGYTAPIVLRNPETGKIAIGPARFGLIPHYVRELGKKKWATMNARSETVATLSSFRTSWSKARFCLIPMRNYFDPNYESGKAVRWSIRRNDADVFCVAGIWSWWKGAEHPDGIATFSMLTLNCDHHPVLKRFHAPMDEKRSLVHIDPSEYQAWLTATSELARVMLQLPDADKLIVEPSPQPPRVKKSEVAEPSLP